MRDVGELHVGEQKRINSESPRREKGIDGTLSTAHCAAGTRTTGQLASRIHIRLRGSTMRSLYPNMVPRSHTMTLGLPVPRILSAEFLITCKQSRARKGISDSKVDQAKNTCADADWLTATTWQFLYQ